MINLDDHLIVGGRITERLYKKAGYRRFLADIGEHTDATWDFGPGPGRRLVVDWPAGEWATEDGGTRAELVGWDPPVVVVGAHVLIGEEDTEATVVATCARRLDKEVARHAVRWIELAPDGDLYSGTTGLLSKLYQDDDLSGHYLVRTEVVFGVRVGEAA